MSLAYLFDPNIQFQDKSGNNNVSGFIRVYYNGTDDYAPTYKDFTGTFNKRDIQLDNNGRCVVIVDEDYTYRIEVYNSEGSCLWTQYPVRPTNVNISYGEYNTYNMSADVYGTQDEIDVTNEENPTTGFKKFFISLSNTVKNTISTLVDNVSTLFTNLSGEITRAQNAESALNTDIGNEVTRATGRENELGTAITNEVTRATAAEKAAKTEVKAGDNIEVSKTIGADGHDIYTIGGVESVPNVQITSPNSTIDVRSSTNVQTNTKTFTIDVKEKPLSLAWVESGNMTYSQNTGRLYTNAYSLLDLNNWQNPQGDKITYDPNTSKLWLAKGYYTIFSRLEITWEGTPQNKTISVGGNPFDLSFNHKASVGISALHQLSATTAIAITVDVSEQPPQGFTVNVKRADICSVQQVMENVVHGLQSVTTDGTLTGDGTSENPLSVVVDNELDADSENPVQNKILYGIIGDVESLLGDL